MKLLRLIILFSALMLSGCSLLSPVQTGAEYTYLVNTVPRCVRHHSAHPRTSLFVALPVASPLYATSDMMYSTYAYQVDRFAKSAWAETPAQMLQPLMVQTLQNTHHFHAVGGTIGVGQFDYMLTSQLVKFQQDFCHGYSVFHLTLQVQLIRSVTNTVIATKRFNIVTETPANTPYGGVIAANKATEKMLHKLARFCLRKI